MSKHKMKKNDSLLIVGYSFSDDHINAELMRIRQMHGNKIRVIIISYLPKDVKDKWYSDSEIKNWPTDNEYRIITYLMGNEVAELFNTFEPPKNDFVESKDKCVRWYLCGFKTAVIKHKAEIINFLTL